MSTGWTIFLAIMACLVVMIVRYNKTHPPLEIKGKVTKKQMAKSANKDSFVTIETDDGEQLELKFDTHQVSGYIVDGDVFFGKAKELDKKISVGDRLKILTRDRSGLTRDVWKLVSISPGGA